MNTKAYLLERFFGVEVFSLAVIGHEFFLAQLVEILHDRIVRRFHFAVIGAVGDAESSVQLGAQNFNGIDLCIRKIFITTEEVL